MLMLMIIEDYPELIWSSRSADYYVA